MDLTTTPAPTHRSGALIADILHARMAGGMGDIMLLILDMGITYGRGLPLQRHPDILIEAMLQGLLDRWHREEHAALEWADPDTPPPAWLRDQQELAESVVRP